MTRTVGVEEEFLLVEGASPFLASAGDQVVAAANEDGAGGEGQFEHELKREQAELGTAPHADIASIDEDLRARRAELAAAARGRGVRLIASGTSPLDQHVSTTANDRYERMTETFGRLARVQLTCGMHVHTSIESRAEGVAVLDRIHGWLPVLLALSANSPFLAGEDTDYASYRSIMWNQWPSAGLADPFGTEQGYDDAVADLIATGAALDDGMIYFDARLSVRYPTLEVRVCDVCADVRDASVIAAMVRALVSTAAADAASGRPAPKLRAELVRSATWRAARWGTEERLIDAHAARLVPAWELIDELVETLAPALKQTGDDVLVRDGLDRIRSRGTGARLQREAYAEGGMAAIVDALADRTCA